MNITTLIKTQHGIVPPVAYYRASLPLGILGDRDRRFRIRVLDQAMVAEMIVRGRSNEIPGDDLYVISRLYASAQREGFLDEVHRTGGRVIFDTDDDLTCSHRPGVARSDEFIDMIKDVDLVTVSTPFLADRMSKIIGYKPPVLFNHVHFDWFSQQSLSTERIVPGLSIGFIGTTTHVEDWKHAAEALKRIVDEYEHVTPVVAGCPVDYMADTPRYVFLDAVPYPKYPELMRQFDVVMCCLDENEIFNFSKSAIKSIEAMSALRVLPNGRLGGAVPVCTDIPVYRRVINRRNGLLTSNSGWYEALKALIEDDHRRLALAEEGPKWVKKHRDIAQGYVNWKHVYHAYLNGKIQGRKTVV